MYTSHHETHHEEELYLKKDPNGHDRILGGCGELVGCNFLYMKNYILMIEYTMKTIDSDSVDVEVQYTPDTEIVEKRNGHTRLGCVDVTVSGGYAKKIVIHK